MMRLLEITGAEIQPGDRIEDGSGVYRRIFGRSVIEEHPMRIALQLNLGSATVVLANGVYGVLRGDFP